MAKFIAQSFCSTSLGKNCKGLQAYIVKAFSCVTVNWLSHPRIRNINVTVSDELLLLSNC